MIDRIDITNEYSVNCDFILNTVIFIDAALNISLRKIWKCNVLSFYLFGQGVPNETKGTINLKSDVRIRNVQSSEPKSVTSNVTLFMPWKRRNQNTCSERAFFAEILSPNIRIFQRIFFKLSSFLVSQNVFMQ